jgi:hypothetical protein
MALSSRALAIMNDLKVAYINGGCPPIREWGFQLPDAPAGELHSQGMIEQADDGVSWILTTAGHAYVMSGR